MNLTFLRKFSATLLLSVAVVASAQKLPTKQEAAARAEKILTQMTLEEKVAYIGGDRDFYIRAIPRLNVPEIKMSDGPLGTRNDGNSTAYPAGIALAASWDIKLAHEMGAALGSDSRARGVNILLGPGLNIYRAPMCGRNFEYFGEDPYLASRMAVADVQGIQSMGVIATAKHYAANNQEWDRNRVSSDVDERTLREIYLPSFEYAVKEGHAGAIMDSYNLVNGVHSTQNTFLNIDVARKDWNFTGIIMSDWEATYDGVAAANGGLDLEMPSGKFMSPTTLLAAVKDGSVKESVIDEKVRRILRTSIEFGFFDRPQKTATPWNDPASRAVALKVAQEGFVLLKNQGGVLPLDRTKFKNIALIGPNAGIPATGGGGSSKIDPFSAVSPVDAVKNLVGDSAKIAYYPGLQLISDVFKTTSFTTTADGDTHGLVTEFFNNKDLTGPPALTRTDEHIAFNWSGGPYAPNGQQENFSARFTGYYTPAADGTYTFAVSGDDGFRLFVDDKPVIEQWVYQGETIVTKALDLKAGQHYKLRLEYFQGGGGAALGFGVTDGKSSALTDAVNAATNADLVILCVGFDDKSEGEGADRTFALPQPQYELIKQVEAANKNTVMVLTAGGNVDMVPFIDNTPALLHVWYPGQEGATAMAQVLFGDINPSGKLPASFERRWEDNATYNSYYDPDKTLHVKYTEGIFVGYRHFDKDNVKPMFPFGYGLSYTTFQYGGLKIGAPSADSTVPVTFTVKNTGKRAGAEIAEVYVGEKNPKVPRPVKELKGFARVELKPGESRSITVNLDRRAFSWYDANSHQWTADTGNYDILIGSSSAKIELTGNVALR
ncbi:glycoside hydrolase, family 3-like protein [Candidatus Koribacter versatilis Ellin345]|uniref:Glycoside hydrolase, family 3-like protein n=1 Tax=Koribacter versatilis (strain Ellin345) TaxID=204669 RepID=Q1IIZ8_KORVE|nr:glycoside hydrolase family 3 C-terminal domain-containing protein [Candidatus Koribacter versatilis]ABF43152.1 glycoside hydrolase, family 3-like protein [Candidatus Koribacter versatilis Ellin345]